MLNIPTAHRVRRPDALVDLEVAIKKNLSAEGLTHHFMRVAEAEGFDTAVGEAVDMRDRGVDEDKIRRYITRRLLRGADDGWSGRGNDVKRAWFDGYRSAAEDILGF